MIWGEGDMRMAKGRGCGTRIIAAHKKARGTRRGLSLRRQKTQPALPVKAHMATIKAQTSHIQTSKAIRQGNGAVWSSMK